jgi:hypothetical protein
VMSEKQLIFTHHSSLITHYFSLKYYGFKA